MELVHKSGKVDRISNLPDEIIHHILSFLDMKYVVQTSQLSRRWKHVWISVPHLNLDFRTFRTLSQFANFVKHALSSHNNQTEVSTVNFNLTGKTAQFVLRSTISRIINYAYLHNAKQLNVTCLASNALVLSQCLSSSRTLKHLTIAAKDFSSFNGSPAELLKSAWDFPALETLNLQNLQVGHSNLFSKCEKLKELTLHRCCMSGLNTFNICAQQLSDLTITNSIAFPKVFNVVAPQLKNFTASVCIYDTTVFARPYYRTAYDTTVFARPYYRTEDFDFLQLSTKGFDSLEKLNLSSSGPVYKKNKIDVPRLLSLFQKLYNAKFLTLDGHIIEALSSCPDQLVCEPCPFNNLKSLKINLLPKKQKEVVETMPSQVRNYFLESSPHATFLMDLTLVGKKRSRQPDTKANEVDKLAEPVSKN